MKRIFFLSALIVVLLVVGVFAVPVAGDINEKTFGFVEGFVEKRGIKADSIKSIELVDFNALPKEINIKNFGDHNLAIYKIEYQDSNKSNQIYVITYSVEKLMSLGDIILAQDKRQFLNFGYKGTIFESMFLETATGVETSLEKGYVMPRDGSITAISTNLEVENPSEGSIEIIIYKNGEPVSFGNTLDGSTIGVKKDYDVQSSGVVTFKAGDVISAYASISGGEGISFKDVITMVEITTLN